MKVGGTRRISRLLDGPSSTNFVQEEESKLLEIPKSSSSYQATEDNTKRNQFLEDASTLAMKRLSRSLLLYSYILLAAFLIYEITIIWGVAFSQQYVRFIFRLRALSLLCAAIGNVYLLAEIDKNIRLDLWNKAAGKNLITSDQRTTMEPSTLRECIMDDSLPMLRQILCWALLLSVLLILTLLSEVLLVGDFLYF